MKPRIAVLAVYLAWAATAAWSQIDPTLARLKLAKVEVITQRQFRQLVEKLEEGLKQPLSKEQRKQYLDALIDEKLLLQAAEREKVKASQTEIDRAMELYRQDLARQLGRSRAFTDAEFKDFLRDQGTSIERFTEQVTNKITIEKLIAKLEKPIIDGVKEPTAAEIRSYYEANRTRFVSPEMVRFKQILLLTTGLSAADSARAKAKAEEIYRAIQSGTPFDKFQEVFLDGSTVRVGGLSFDIWRRDDEKKRAAYGSAFFDTLFGVEPGRPRGVLQSNVGYHIVEVIEQIPFSVLGLEDKIPPQNATTVKDYVAGLLRQSRQAEAMQRAAEELTKKLRGEAEIRIDENLLVW